MYKWLIGLMMVAALAEAGLSYKDFFCSFYSRDCQLRVLKARNDVLKIDWKPITIFPEEAKWFR